MLKPLGIVTAAFVIAALGAAGCGSSSKSSSTPAITKAAFVAKGNAICKDGNRKLNAAEGQAFGKTKPSKAEATSFAKTSFVPIVQGQIDAIRALGAPSGDEATVRKILDTAQKGLDTVKSNPALLAGGPDSFSDFRKLAHPYGLTACASG
jgi:hypothetical protein